MCFIFFHKNVKNSRYVFIIHYHLSFYYSIPNNTLNNFSGLLVSIYFEFDCIQYSNIIYSFY